MVDRFPPMLDYDWGGNPIYSAAEDSHHHPRQIFDPFAPPPPPTHESLIYPSLHPSGGGGFPQQFLQSSHAHLQPSILYDPRAFGGASGYAHHPSLDSSSSSSPTSGGGGFMVVPKSEPCGGMTDFTATIGLNLGGRTYFSASDDDFVNRLYRRSRAAAGEAIGANMTRCQAEGCNADLSHAKHYHRRHKVCEFHSKAANVISAGLTQRFCQQCSRFHTLSEFDGAKRSCRKRLADHNRRRRKSHQAGDKAGQAAARSSPPCNDHTSDSGAQSCSSVTVAISPPRISLEYFGSGRQSTSLFYSSNG